MFDVNDGRAWRHSETQQPGVSSGGGASGVRLSSAREPGVSSAGGASGVRLSIAQQPGAVVLSRLPAGGVRRGTEAAA